ncbi:MAG: 1-deoxy-D-xylulose-5-phosphate synthase [SAR86 cluster bacterium]|nr:1-deoxy-D-xylulose-5-phosphate synthase [SAR86 cluster bacterium]
MLKIFEEIPVQKPSGGLLASVNLPSDLRKLDMKKLPQFADELREYLLYSVGQTGGHFGAGLGVVELTIALHYAFDTPKDKIIWDVGHQTYPHKIITGRKEAMDTIRQTNGLSPFLSRQESEYDSFGAGHSSTSISAALGMAAAARHKGEDKDVVAVIGDGAMTAGMAYEALSHAGSIDEKVLVILNDNQMSISENVGGLKNYLARIWASPLYNQIRQGGKTVLRFIPAATRLARKAEIQAKGMLTPGTLFEELGLSYIGPVNGHDPVALVKILNDLKNLDGPRLLHVITQKGKGFLPAELDPIGFHAINKIQPLKKQNIEKLPTYSDLFGEWLCYKAKKDNRLTAITPAMREGSGMVKFSKEFPDRYYDVAIAEQHSVSLAAGMACEGLKPVVAIYSTFLQRAYDQLIHDVALQDLDVLFAIDRAGLVGADGPTHQGAFDISFLRCIPNMVIMTPSNENIAWKMLNTGFDHQGPASIRYPRGSGPGSQVEKDDATLQLGKSTLIKSSGDKKISIMNFGSTLKLASEIADDFDASLFDMNFVKPLDQEKILQLAKENKLLVTIEENVVKGGAGSAVVEFLAENNQMISILNFGISDEFVQHGSPDHQKVSSGLGKEEITEKIRKRLDQL